WASTFIGEFTAPVLSADGRDVYVIASQNRGDGRKVTRVVELDARTGRQLRVLFERPFTGSGGNVQWEFTELARDPTGRPLLVVDGTGTCYRIDVRTAQTAQFPFPRGADPNSIAW